MSFFLREITPIRENAPDAADNLPESTRVSRQLSNLLYKCAENTCKSEILKIPSVLDTASAHSKEDKARDNAILESMDVLNSKFVVGPPSSFACIAMAKCILARYGGYELKKQLAGGDTPKCNEEVDESSGIKTDQLVGTSLTCVFDVLQQLSRRDSDLCVQALDSLLSLIQAMPIECLKSENRISVASMMQVLKNLREEGSPAVCSKATSCLAALSIASGEPEHLSSAIQSLICITAKRRGSLDSTYDCIQIPENLRKVLLKIQRKVHQRSDGVPCWASTAIENHAVSCSFDLPSLPDSSPNDTPDDDHRLYSTIACDGSFVYVLNYVGLYKLGSGLQETVIGKLYAANQGLKATKNCMMALCNGSLYLRRSHSSCISVIDTDSLQDIGEVILPPGAVQNALFSDGSNFYSAILVANSTLSTIQLNDSFVPSTESMSRKNFRLTDVTFTAYGDTRPPHILPRHLPNNLHSQAADLHISKDMALLQARSGKVYYAGNGTRFGLQETGNTWMELVLPEPIVQISVGVDHILFRSGAGHAWIASFDEKKKHNGRMKRLFAPVRRKIVSIASSGHMYAYVTENGKAFLGGHHNMRVNASNQSIAGMDWVHVSSIVLGKTHGVAVTRNGNIVTWGLNNLNQCGRSDVPTSTTNSPKKTAIPICPIGEHIWVNDMPTICAQCGLCSARGASCGKAPRQKGNACVCGTGESTCLRCGLCRPCGEITEPAAPGSLQHIPFSSAIPPRATVSPGKLNLSKSVPDVKVSSVCCGNFHTVILAADRRVFTFGSNCHGQLGTGDISSKSTPQQVILPADLVVVQIAAGSNHTVLRTSDGSVYTFGAYSKGQLARQAGDRQNWNSIPGRVPGYGPGYSAFAGWIGAEGDSTIIHSHTALLSSDDVLNAQIVATKQNIFIFPREVGRDYIVIRRRQNSFEHHSIGAAGLYASWTIEPNFDMLWSYNAAEMRVQAYSVFQKQDELVSNPLDSLTYQTSPEFAIQLEPGCYTSSLHMGILLLSATFSANVMQNAEFWKDKNSDPSFADMAPTDSYSVVSRFEGTGGGWGYSAHSIEAIQFKVSKEIRLVGVGLYGGRGEYISKLKLYRLLGNEGDELYVEQISETDETMYECGAHETATLLFSQTIVIQPNQWHVVSAKISGPSSDCGANGKHTVECDGVIFSFRNSIVSNNGTDVNVGQIPELYYQLNNSTDGRENEELLRKNSLTSSRLFSSNLIENVTPKGIASILEVLEWSIQKVQNDEEESIERLWMHERFAFIALLSMRLLSRQIRTIYQEGSIQDEPSIDFANKLVNLHSMLLEFFSIDISSFEDRYALSQVLAESVKFFVSLSHCFLGSRSLINAHLIAIMNSHRSPILTAVVIGSIAKMEKITNKILHNCAEDTYPMLSSLLLKHFDCEKETLASLTSFSNVLRFLYDKTFQCNQIPIHDSSKLAENIIVKISQELAIPEDDNAMGPVIHQHMSRFRRRSAVPNWDMSDGCPDSIAFRVDSEGIKLHGFGIYLPTEHDKRQFTGEILMLSPDSSEKWTCLLRVTADMSSEDKETGIIKFTEYVLLSPGITYAIKLCMTKNGKTYCGESGTAQIRLVNGTRLFFSGCSLSHNGTTVQRGQIPFILYSVMDQSKTSHITQEMIHDSFLLLLRLATNKIGSAIGLGEIPETGRSLISRISPHIMVFMERFPDKSLEIMSTLEQLIPLVSNMNGTIETSESEEWRDNELSESACIPIVVESPHPYKPNSVFSMVVGFNENIDFMCIRFSPNCETAQFDDQLTIYVGVNGHSYMPVERCYGSHDWPNYPMILPGNSLWFVLETSTSVEGATFEQMFGYHVTVSGYMSTEKDSNLRLEQELVWLSANACRIMVQLPVNPKSIEHLSTAEDDTRHLFEKHGSLLKKGLSLSHSPTLAELITKGHPPSAQSPDLLFLKEFLAAHPATSSGFLARWLPAGPVVDPSKCQLAISGEEMVVGKPVKIKLSCRDQFDREVECPKLIVEVFATLGARSSKISMHGKLSGDSLPSALLIQQNPFQAIIANRTRYMNICAMPAFANYSIEEIRLGFMKEDLVKDKAVLTSQGKSIFCGNWTPSVPGNYRLECKVDGYDIAHTYSVEIVEMTNKPEEKVVHRGAQMKTAQTAVIPFTSAFSGLRMRLGTTLASTPVGVIPRGAIIEFIEEIENDDGKWIRLTDETALLYGCTIGSGQIWCLAYHRALRRQLIPLGDKQNREKTVKLRKKIVESEERNTKHHSISIDADETYLLSSTDTLQVYSQPTPNAIIRGEKIVGPQEIVSSGWLTNRHGVWIKLAGAEKYVLQSVDASSDNLERSLNFSTNGNEEEIDCGREREVPRHLPIAIQPSVADCIRAVFAAFVWHEHLVKDLMAAAAYLRFHQNLHNIWQSCDVPATSNAPAALQPIVKIWREICEVVQVSVEQHLIMPAVTNKTLLADSIKQSVGSGGCELCDETFKVPLTVHLRMAHPGCGGDCLGYGYNSNGKFTTGWSGECGTGGRGQAPWYLMCNNCRSQYLRKTPAGHHMERTRRWREFRFSTSASEARPEVIIRLNALFLLDLNSSLHSDSANSSTATSGWTINLFPTHSSTPSTMPKSVKKIDSSIAKTSYMAQSLMKTGYSSDPGPKACSILSPPGNGPDQTASLNRHGNVPAPTEVLQSPSAALRTLFSNATPSTTALLKRPVLAFCVEHHDLKRIRAACAQSVRRAVAFSHALRVWNWLLRMVSSETSVSDVILQYLTALTSYNRLAEYIYSSKKNANILPHPWRLCFLAGPIAGEMVCQLHSFLHTVSIILQSSGVDGRLRSLCFKAWTLQLTAQEQDLLILTCNILATVGGVLSDTSINEISRITKNEEMIDVTKFVKITASSRQAMVICLTDESGETFWESGDEDKNRSRTLNVQIEEEATGVLLSVFIDNVRDDGYRVHSVAFKAIEADGSKKDLNFINVENNYTGWVKCCIATVRHIQITFKGPSPSSRVRQLAVLGFTEKITATSSLPPSSSHHLFFSNTQRDAFALFQAISSQAFCGEFSEDDTLREHVIDLLFSRVQLYPLQNYVYNQVVQAMQREVELLCQKSKRNYSYCCGLMGLLVRICDCNVSADISGQKNTILSSITQLLVFAPLVVQRQCLNSLECIFRSFTPNAVEVSKIIRNLLIVVGKVIQLQVRDKAAHTVVTVHLCSSLVNAPQNWRVDRPIDIEIGRQTAQLIMSICDGTYSDDWAEAARAELANTLLSLVQMPESMSFSEQLSSGRARSSGIIGSKRFWLAVASLALIKDKKWLELSERWRTVQEQVEDEPVILCENHDDGSTVAQVFCLDCDVALCKECFTVMHLHKKNRNHGVKSLAQSNVQHDINIHQGCARMKLMNLLVLFHGEALNGMVEITSDVIFPSSSGNPMQSSAFSPGNQNSFCRFCGNSVPSHEQNLDGTCSHDDCVNYAKTACNKVHSCGHFCGGIKDEVDCLPCMTCKRSDANQDSDDVCVICFTERLGAAPCIRLECDHIFHYHCVRMILDRRWNGPRIVFRFMHCPLCIQKISHPGLTDLLEPLLVIRQEVIEKAKMRLEYDGLMSSPALTDPRSEFFNQPEEYALDRYMYVLCHKCKKAYFGGESRCQAALDSSQYNPEELICGACSDTTGVQVCPRHGVEFLEYKCRFCCSIAVYFCFGTTHFCAPCHDDFQRLMTLPKNLLPPCPVGPRSMPLDEPSCPLKMKHPPTGEEFAMGCGICRNISTF
ncbi:unnamed protein product [Caenorhabditis bovis]|uniref:RCR-type E3 ubiquitin transferase n=1 Tax=Caenorhabditis bovis TaxID=2654633 RepID=A0A8S1EEJ0_9PELO|nr:unnamed protein product [Caenorhabditis bovis]